MKDKKRFENAASTVFAPQLVGLVTTIDRANRPNVATFAWIMSTSHDPELLAVSVLRQRYTYECLTDEFVINLPTKQLLEQVWAVGTRSGRNVDKFQAIGLTPIRRRSGEAAPDCRVSDPHRMPHHRHARHWRPHHLCRRSRGKIR